MALTITGNQFVKVADSQAYTVAGIPSGYVLSNVMMPNAWTPFSLGAIAAGSQIITFTVGIGSGTLGISYSKDGKTKTVYLDIYTGATRMGEELKEDGAVLVFPAISAPVSPFNPPACGDEDIYGQQPDCIFKLDVFADLTDGNADIFNDKSDFYYYDTVEVSDKILTLQKNTNNCGGCTWEDVIEFPDGPEYGDFFAYGKSPDFSGDDFVDDYGKKYTGLLLNWYSVLDDFGAGQYRMKISSTNAFTSVVTETYDVRLFCLHQKNDYNMDSSVRIDTINSGLRGTLNDKTIQIDYGTAWEGQIRFKGIFYETKPSYNKEFNQYGDADFNTMKPIIHELSPKFVMDIKPVPGWADWILENYIMLADEILITDYNTSNRKVLIKVPVINENGIDTKDEVFMNQLAWSQLFFSYAQNNLRKRNS